MKAEIIAIGTEILLGEIIDTNSAYIAKQLPELGIDLMYKSVVGDNRGRIVETFRRGWERSDLIIVTGGLGPTDDDMTREGIAEMLGEEPHVDPELEKHLRGFFAGRGYPMPESNLKQAWLIPSARTLLNPRGTAPGWWVERDGHVIVTMPGVPPEMERMWANEVRPELERRSTSEVLVTRTIKTLGIGEGTVDEMAKP
ncbi:MAG: competence/damage-inducible protein A, partial [Tepidiformaceae bacterium]